MFEWYLWYNWIILPQENIINEVWGSRMYVWLNNVGVPES